MVVATGFFDGVHIGHRLVIGQLVEAAAVRGDESMVVTFWPHPRNVLQKEARTLRLLTTLDEKKTILHSLGVDRVEVLPFTKKFSSMTTREYLRMLMDEYGAKAVLIGYDNRMGCDAAGADQVAQIAAGLGLEVIRTDMVPATAGYAVSSTKIRERLDTIEDIQGNKTNIEWGAQIRSYVFMPYTLAKDTRTGYEDGNINAVMDGEIDGFINAYLKMNAGN